MTDPERRREGGDHGTRIALLEYSTSAIQKQLEGRPTCGGLEP